MEVIKERLEREFGLDLLATAPSVEYHVYLKGGEMVSLHSPQEMPDPGSIDHVEEPYLKAKILIPPDYVGAVMDLAVGRRGNFVTMNYLSQTTVEMLWEIPLSELILDFFDKLKSNTKGYASLDYEIDGYKPSQLVKLDILLSGNAHRRAVVHRAQGQGLRPRARALRQAEGDHPAPDVRGAHPGGHRRQRCSRARP